MADRNRQTTRLLRYWGISVILVFLFFSLCIGFISISQQHRLQQGEFETITAVIDHYLQNHAQQDSPSPWLTDLLRQLDVVEMQVVRDGELLLHWQQQHPPKSVKTYQAQLSGGERVSLGHQSKLSLVPNFSVDDWLILICGFVVSLLSIALGYGWLKGEMTGIELLAGRAGRVVAGDFDAAGLVLKGERPLVVSRALKKLHRLWRQERAAKLELDRQIRANAFLDSELGLGNSAFFESRLQALTESGQLKGQGVVILVQFDGLDCLKISGRVAALRQFVDHCQPLLEDRPDVVFARRHWLQLALLVPGVSQKQADGLAERLQGIAERMVLSKQVPLEQLVYLGMAYFVPDERPVQIMDEAEMALRAAQLQGHNNWFMYDKGAVDQLLAEGTVRWRSLIERALAKDGLLGFYQPILGTDKTLIASEMFSRLRDPNGQLVRASLYRPMAKQCGLVPKIELQLIGMSLEQMAQRDEPGSVFVNVTVESLLHERFAKSVTMLLANYQARRSRLILEIKEFELVSHVEALAPILTELKRAGVQLSVDSIGLTVARTDYIERFDIDWLKLHPSLVRQVQLRPEHQLVVISLLQAAVYSKSKVLAEGVESKGEWETLLALGVRGGQGPLFGSARAFEADGEK